MKDLAKQRCFNHLHRESAAICPECSRFFCRECVTEHDDRILCASCLKKILRPSFIKRFRFAGFLRTGCCIFGFLTAWLFFYYLGQALLSIPSSFHEGTFWQDGGLNDQR
ncbi:MAG TPA: rhomboid family protein [Nitrospirae bacterium]|nr:rhomboid family protein [Nitrospirota bacterium]